MSTQPLAGRTISRGSASLALRAALAALAALALSGHSLWAQTFSGTQALLNTALAPKTILNATPAALEGAIITVNTNNPTISIAVLAGQAFTATTGSKVEARSGSTAGDVVNLLSTAILTNNSNTVLTDGTEIAAIVDAVADVNASTTKELSVADQGAVADGAVAAVSDNAETNNNLLAVDENIGTTLAADVYLQGLPKDGLTTILADAIKGINGAKGHSQSVAPVAAEDLVEGIVSSGNVPDASQSATFTTFAEAILKNVSKNASVDELVTYQIALKDAGTSNWTALAAGLYSKYSADISKITQGIIAAAPQDFNNETARQGVVSSIVASANKDAATIDQGATFVDPRYAYAFTDSTLTTLYAAGGGGVKGEKLAAKYAATIATDEGNVLGQDGDELANVAGTFASLITAGDLLASNAATYAKDLLTGAEKSKIPVTEFSVSSGAFGLGGGTLNLSAPATETVQDMASIADLFAVTIIDNNGGGTTAAKTDASEIGALIKDIASFSKSATFTDTDANAANQSDVVGIFLAGTLVDEVTASVNALSLGVTETTAIDSAVEDAVDKDLKSVVGRTNDPTLETTVTTDFSNYPIVGAITVSETTVTNL